MYWQGQAVLYDQLLDARRLLHPTWSDWLLN
jgi:hypothetical protein